MTLTLDTILDLTDINKLIDDYQYDVDDFVHEAAAEDDSIDTSGVEDEDIENIRSHWASNLNNQGIEDQLTYLLHHGWHLNILDMAISCAKNGHARMKLETLKKEQEEPFYK